MKQLLSDKDWDRNVGTESHPVSFLHEYGVALIYDQLVPGNEVCLPLLNGERSGNVMGGVSHVKLPDSLQPVGGYMPDIALYDDSFRVLAVIEVVVTSPVSAAKLLSLENQGVEVLQVPVRTEDELRALFPPTTDLDWWPKLYRGLYRKAREKLGVNWKGSRQGKALEAQEDANKAISTLMDQLSYCSPEVRRQFVSQLGNISCLDSMYPIMTGNPKLEVLEEEA